MNLQEYNERIKLLLEQNVITEDSYEIGLSAFHQLMDTLNKSDIEQSEMLFTHLPMALTRIDSSEAVETPSEAMMSEVRNSEFFPIAKKQISHVEKMLQKSLPQGEKEYLYMHYVNVLNNNEKG